MKETKFVVVDPADCVENPDGSIKNSAVSEELTYAAKVLRSGGLVVFPTETVYGLGGNATDPEAAKKIYAAKNRPSDNPLIIHIATPGDAEKYAYTNELYYKFAKAFMPGPLTIILPRKNTIPLETTGGLESVAVRCPSNPIAHELIKITGVPIAAPSANLSGKPSPTNAVHVRDDMNGRVDIIIDGGNCDIGLESTIIKLENDSDKVTLLRPGGITYDALCCVSDNVVVSDAVVNKLADNERPLSPGMKYRHYAPTAPVVLLEGNETDVVSFLKAETENKSKKCLILCYSEETKLLPSENIIDIGAMNDLDTQAKRLFTALRNADKLSPDIIYAHLPPKDGIGLALYNRMIRAAAHTIKKIKKDDIQNAPNNS